MTGGGDRPRRRVPARSGWRPFLVAVVGVSLIAVGILVLAVAPWGTPARTTGDAGIDESLQRLHAAGVTDEDVSVGVVDVTGFDRSLPELEGRVVAARNFGPGDGSGAVSDAATNATRPERSSSRRPATSAAVTGAAGTGTSLTGRSASRGACATTSLAKTAR